MPKVTIGIPTYNSEKRISNALTSALSQDYPNLEILISDNASQDNTEEVCRAYCSNNSRVTYIRQPENIGAIPNFNFVLQHSTSKYFMWFADDDKIEDNVVSKFVDFMEKNPGYSLVGGRTCYYHDNTKRLNNILSMEHDSPMVRVCRAYRYAGDGSMIHGLIRRNLAEGLKLEPIIGDDWHFIAGLAFQGKTKMLDLVGYHKFGCNTSATFEQYAKSIGERAIWGKHPFVKISLDAFRQIAYKNTTFRRLAFPARVLLGGLAVSCVMLVNVTIYLGRILRFFKIKTPGERRYEKNTAELNLS